MRHVSLTKGYYALVDDEDYQRVSQFKWCASENFVNGKLWNVYAVRGIRVKGNWRKCKMQLMHRFILGLDMSRNPAVDHYPDSSGLNNQRHNLRLATNTENHQNAKRRSDNTSGYKGVVWRKSRRQWVASIKVNSKQIYIGQFAKAEEAARAYDEAATKHFGRFAYTNERLGLL